MLSYCVRSEKRLQISKTEVACSESKAKYGSRKIVLHHMGDLLKSLVFRTMAQAKKSNSCIPKL